MLSICLSLGLASAFMPQTAQLTRATVQPSSSVVMGANRGLFRDGSFDNAERGKKARPLSYGSNYPTTKNIQYQRNGFGTFVQKFQLSKGQSKYGVPIFLANGNVNPAYLEAERKDIRSQSARNVQATNAKRKKLIQNDAYTLASWLRKSVGAVGSGKEYYQSGK